jgi:hypothetical protein
MDKSESANRRLGRVAECEPAGGTQGRLMDHKKAQAQIPFLNRCGSCRMSLSNRGFAKKVTRCFFLDPQGTFVQTVE